MATGRSEFPNQLNNSLGFLGILRGGLDIRSTHITDEMCIVTAREIAKVAGDNGIPEGYIVPYMEEWKVFPREVVAGGTKGFEQGVARIQGPADVRLKLAEDRIRKCAKKFEPG